MTSDLDITTDDIYDTIRRLWDTGRQPVADADIAEETGLDLQVVREYLHNADGEQFEIGHDGESRTVIAIL